MKNGKNIIIIVLAAIIVCLLFYSQILKIEIGNISTGFDDCYKMMNYYADSLENEKIKYEEIIRELKQGNQVLKDSVQYK